MYKYGSFVNKAQKIKNGKTLDNLTTEKTRTRIITLADSLSL